MSFWGVVLGSVLQAVLALFLFMLAAFAGGGAVNGRSTTIRKSTLFVLNAAIYALPLSCFVSAGIVICGFASGIVSGNFYWWYALPPGLAMAYSAFVTRI